MITKMKKLTFLVYHKEYEEFLNSLRELGVVHIVEKQQGLLITRSCRRIFVFPIAWRLP